MRRNLRPRNNKYTDLVALWLRHMNKLILLQEMVRHNSADSLRAAWMSNDLNIKWQDFYLYFVSILWCQAIMFAEGFLQNNDPHMTPLNNVLYSAPIERQEDPQVALAANLELQAKLTKILQQIKKLSCPIRKAIKVRKFPPYIQINSLCPPVLPLDIADVYYSRLKCTIIINLGDPPLLRALSVEVKRRQSMAAARLTDTPPSTDIMDLSQHDWIQIAIAVNFMLM